MAAGFDHHDGVLEVRGGMFRQDDKKFGVHRVECTPPEAEQYDPDFTHGMCSMEKATKVQITSHKDHLLRGRVRQNIRVARGRRHDLRDPHSLVARVLQHLERDSVNVLVDQDLHHV
jgi:hypothetical protein